MVLCGVSAFLLSVYPSDASYKEPTREEYAYRSNLIAFEPTTPAVEQTKYIKGSTFSNSNIGAYLYQLDDGRWVADYDGQKQYIQPTGGNDPRLPVEDNINIKIDFDKEVYAPDQGFTLEDPSFTYRIDPKLMKHKKVVYVVGKSQRNGFLNYANPLSEDNNQFKLNIRIGTPSYEPWDGSVVWIPNEAGVPKYSATYGVQSTITWWGVYQESKKIELKANNKMALNTSQQAVANVDWRQPRLPDIYEYTGTGKDVSGDSETTWSVVSGNSITVTSSGLVQAVSKGKSTLQVDWNKDGYKLRATMDIYVDEEPPPDGGGSDPTPGIGKCSPPSKTSSIKNNASTMIPNVTGTIRADDRDAEKFNVDLGIPTTESLFVNVLSKDYLNEYDFGKWEGTCTYPIKVTKTYNLKWESCSTYTDSEGKSHESCTSMSDTETVTKTYNVKREYSYWALDIWRAFQIEKARASNYALPSGEVTLLPHGYTPPNISSTKLSSWQAHITEPSYSDKDLGSQTLNGGRSRPSVPNEDWTSVAEGQVGQVKVKNDSLKIDSTTVMNDGQYEKSTPAPTTPRQAVQIGRDVLYEKNLVIEATKRNGHDYISTGDITYKPLNYVDADPGNKVFPITDYDDITIHTPVVNYSTIPDINRPFDQSLHPDMSRIAFVLNRNQNLIFPNNGQHRNIPGYGNRDYTKYTQEKRIQFPFDIYKGNTFYKANSWITLDLTQDTTVFKIPYWVTEGVYTVRTESWAINSPSRDSSITEHNANLNLDNYGAYETFNVKVLGRVYGFRVYDVGDLRFESVFRTAKGSTDWSGFQYYSGAKDLDGNPSAVASEPWKQLPVRVGSHPTERGTVAHNGYPFYFFFNTMGNVWNSNEGVKIVPRFYFVPKSGGTPVEVDLYYNSTNKKLIKVGSAEDKKLFDRTIVMSDPLRNINTQYLEYAAVFEYNNFLTAEAKAKTSLTKYVKQALKRKVVQAHGYKDMVLDLKSRTLIGSPDEPQVDSGVQQRAIQRWFGEYSLPVAPYAVAKGTDLESLVRTKYKGKITGKESEFKKNGYLIVNFDITTYRNNPDDGIFAYDASRAGMANMWEIENEVKQSTAWTGSVFRFNSGDIMMFESDFSARQDVKNKGW